MDNYDHRLDVLKTGYQEVCQRYKGIDDFRLKLLGLLPLTTSGIFLLLKSSPTLGHTTTYRFSFAVPYYGEVAVPYWSGEVTGPIGLFGFVATLGLFFYELRGMQYCIALIRAGQDIEKELGLEGCFRRRPRRVAGFFGVRAAAGVIYPGVLAAWIYLASYNAWATVVSFFGLMAVYHSLDLEGCRGRALDCPKCPEDTPARRKHLWARTDKKLECEVRKHLKKHHSSIEPLSESESKSMVKKYAKQEYKYFATRLLRKCN